jgi:uncharacterized protein (TIGR02246 family)
MTVDQISDAIITGMDPNAVATTTFEVLEQAWNRADGAAFGAVFADESDFVDIRGEHHRGDGAAIGHGHQAIFDTIYEGSQVRFEVDVARVVAPGCVVAVVTSTLDAPGGPLAGTNHSRITAVITEQGDRWAVTAFQNTLVGAAS